MILGGGIPDGGALPKKNRYVHSLHITTTILVPTTLGTKIMLLKPDVGVEPTTLRCTE